MSAQTIDFQADPRVPANLASFRNPHRRKLRRHALPPTANRFCRGPSRPLRYLPPPPARFARPREPTFSHRTHRQNLHDPVAQTNANPPRKPATIRQSALDMQRRSHHGATPLLAARLPNCLARAHVQHDRHAHSRRAALCVPSTLHRKCRPSANRFVVDHPGHLAIRHLPPPSRLASLAPANLLSLIESIGRNSTGL